MLLDRRSFCASLGASLLGGVGALACASSPRATSAPNSASMGVPAAAGMAAAGAGGGNVGPVGVQLYTVRDAMARDFDGTLARVRGLGYEEVEFAGYYNREPQAVRAALDRLGLRSPSTHVPIDQWDANLDKIIAASRVIGHQWIVLPYLTPDQRPNEAGWRQLATRLNTWGARVRDAGMRVAYHNHDFEFKPTDSGAIPLELMLAGTDPAVVDFEMDLYWVTYAGQDPLAWFARHPGRFKLLHLKDGRGEGDGPVRTMAPVGGGRIDFARILSHRAQAGAQHVYVEQDNAAQVGDAFAAIKASRDYLAALRVPTAG